MLVGTHVRAVDEVQAPIQVPRGVGFAMQYCQRTLPDARLAPVVEAAGHRPPVAEALRQVPPLCARAVEPEDAFHDAPMVAGRASSPPGTLWWQEGLQLRPLRVGQFASFSVHVGQSTPFCQHALVAYYAARSTEKGQKASVS